MIDDLACLTYLLAHDETAEGPYDRSRTALLLRAAALTDLALRGRLGEEHGTVTVHGTGSTGDPVLDGVLREAAGHGWKHLVRRHRRRTLTEVEDRLAAAGLLTVRASRGLLGSRRSTTVDPSAAAAVRDRVLAALHGTGPVERLPAADAALLALAAAGGIPSVVPRRHRTLHRSRVDACTRRLGALAPGLERTVRTLPTTMIAARGGMGGG
ncbi:GOLPH3/VPS74 family protein [Streptomyces griseoaurantiacus]|uniref:Golgi phosphoprotein 3 (GPP34) n=1 Tax=Streptomyces griseoaurantiacus TaxID=68213 RepID=A0A1G7MMA2_9ACTN|nr:GPP34 family phosphoprotein [Streptomyces jietaisiensis]SDF62882.1 Golgi phosphoprotein 3 (GPP34) [Streptomyces jietaisiensis]